MNALAVQPLLVDGGQKLIVLTRKIVGGGERAHNWKIVILEVGRYSVTEEGSPGGLDQVIWRDSSHYLDPILPRPSWHGALAVAARAGRTNLVLANDIFGAVKVRVYELDPEGESETQVESVDEKGTLVLPPEDTRPRPLAEYEIQVEQRGCRIVGLDALHRGERLVVSFVPAAKECRIPMLAYDLVQRQWAEVEITHAESEQETE